MSLQLPRRKKLHLVQLVAVIFLTVSGGPYGIEPLLTYAGHNGALLLLLITPLLWDIPTIFTVLELNGMMPVTGGYYQWVKKHLACVLLFMKAGGRGCTRSSTSRYTRFCFVQYASFFFPQIAPYKIPICLLIVWGGALLNILGILKVGKASMILGVAVLTPFLILFVTATTHLNMHLNFSVLSLKGHSIFIIGFSHLYCDVEFYWMG
jgi:amino acid transporter